MRVIVWVCLQRGVKKQTDKKHYFYSTERKSPKIWIQGPSHLQNKSMVMEASFQQGHLKILFDRMSAQK